MAGGAHAAAGRLRDDLAKVHLTGRLRTTAILTSAQIAACNCLRGYAT